MKRKTRKHSKPGKERALARDLKPGETAVSHADNVHLAGEGVGAVTALTARPPDIVWSHTEFTRELEKARKIDPQNMSNDRLMSFCVGVTAYYNGRFLVDARPFFVELWRRIRKGQLRMSKSEACRRIGCSRQWANAIVSGRADERREERKAKGAKTGNSGSEADASTRLLTEDEYVREISKKAFEMLEPLLGNHWDLYRAICGRLGKQFIQASETPPVPKVLAAGAD